MEYKVYYEVDKKRYVNESEFLSIEVKNEKNHFSLILHPKRKIILKDSVVVFDDRLDYKEKFYSNGFQSWTDTKEIGVFGWTKRKMRNPLALLADNVFHFTSYGDYTFVKYHQHYSFSFTYLRNEEDYRFYGSIDERNGYTIFYVNRHTLKATKEKMSLEIEKDYVLYDVAILKGKEDEVYDEYFKIIAKGRTLKYKDKITGFTSWYRHYDHIKESDILTDIKKIKEKGLNFEFFQIDDGYQSKVGDWMVTDKEKFPNGLTPCVKEIKEQGLKCGLWMAPFVASKESEVFKKHPDWMVKKENGEYLIAGANWGGAYIFDFYNPEVREYIHTFFKFYKDMGVELFKLDFLYTVAILPRKDKSRGQIMTEAMEFIREELKDCRFLACGVPIFPSFFNCDYCRIGTDISLKYDDFLYMHLFHRERVSTKLSIMNTINRRQLNLRGFLNDPDVMLMVGTMMLPEHKDRLYKMNKKYGSVYFTSDDVSLYTDKEINRWKNIMNPDYVD